MSDIQWLMIGTSNKLIGKSYTRRARWIVLGEIAHTYPGIIYINNKSDEDQVNLLESLGLSLNEIQEYFDNENNMANSR